MKILKWMAIGLFVWIFFVLAQATALILIWAGISAVWGVP